MPENPETQIITTEYLHRIEVALNIPSGHTDISPAIRLEAILQAIKVMSHRAGHVNLQYCQLLNGLVDFLDNIEIDFSKFEYETEYREEWDKWKERFYQRPRYLSTPPKEKTEEK